MEWFVQIHNALNYVFIQRALMAGCFVALACACLGVFLVLRRFALMGDGIAHMSFASMALGLLLNVDPFMLSLPIIIIISFLIFRITEKGQVYGDSAIGMISSLGVALGVFLASVAGGFNVDLFSFLFGNILAVSQREVVIAIILSVVVISFVFLFYYDLLAVTFDEEYAKVSGVKISRLNIIFIILMALTVMLGIKVVGTMLVTSLIILPASTALQLGRSFKAVLCLAGILAVFSVISGVFLSYIYNVPTGATIVLINFGFFVVAFLFRKFIVKN